MTSIRIFFLTLSGALALLGLFTIAAAQDTPMRIFGWGVVAYGCLFGFSLVKRHFDDAERELPIWKMPAAPDEADPARLPALRGAAE